MKLSLSMMQAFPCIYRLFLLSLLEEDNEQFQTRDDSASRKRDQERAAQAAAARWRRAPFDGWRKKAAGDGRKQQVMGQS